MLKLTLLSLLLVLINAEPKTPKVYNVLISTKKNLSPSHTLPVYEPVLTTTSLGIAVPSFFYPTHTIYQPTIPVNNYVIKNEPATQTEHEEPGSEPLPVDRFVSYSYTPQISTEMQFQSQRSENGEDPKNVIANLKRNPEIPDVPPPALPVRSSQA